MEKKEINILCVRAGEMGGAVCNECMSVLPPDGFHNNRFVPGGFSMCKKCHNARLREKYAKDVKFRETKKKTRNECYARKRVEYLKKKAELSSSSVKQPLKN